jgi:site-specific recombinase XerD
MRVSEAAHLRATDIDSQRMTIRIERGKGRKDRYVHHPYSDGLPRGVPKNV